MNSLSLILIMIIKLCLIPKFNVSRQSSNDEEINVLNLNSAKNCSFVDEEVFCDCNENDGEFKCYNIESAEDLIFAFNYLLNTTKKYYWSLLEVNCIEPFVTSLKSFHITSNIFTNGPKFEQIIFIGDCSKPKHYDNLIAIDKDIEKIFMTRNTLRMATSCSLFQTKLEKLLELVISDSLVAGDMISATFSTRCLGQYGTRNEALPLVRLKITSCNITLIESGAFFNFAELQSIDLSNNQLSHLSRQVFASHLYKLRFFNLQNNRLNALSPEFFEKLPQLRVVNLAGNFLTTLPFIPLTGVPQEILLEGNQFDCRCKLSWIINDSNEKGDNQRFYDEPKCATPENVKDFPLMKGLRFVDQTFC